MTHSRWSELPTETRVEVTRWINVLATFRSNDAETQRIMRTAREALPGTRNQKTSWWRRMLLKAAGRGQ